MHSTKRARITGVALCTLLLGGLGLAGSAQADDRDRDRGRRTSTLREHREADAREGRRLRARTRAREAHHYDRMLDRRGEAIDFHLDVLALVSAFAGDHALAYELDRRGDRIERRLDRRGDRAVRKARKQLHRTRHDGHGWHDHRSLRKPLRGHSGLHGKKLGHGKGHGHVDRDHHHRRGGHGFAGHRLRWRHDAGRHRR